MEHMNEYHQTVEFLTKYYTDTHKELFRLYQSLELKSENYLGTQDSKAWVTGYAPHRRLHYPPAGH